MFKCKDTCLQKHLILICMEYALTKLIQMFLWLADNSKVYSVKSAYQILQSQQQIFLSSPALEQVFANFWFYYAPSKVLAFSGNLSQTVCVQDRIYSINRGLQMIPKLIASCVVLMPKQQYISSLSAPSLHMYGIMFLNGQDPPGQFPVILFNTITSIGH